MNQYIYIYLPLSIRSSLYLLSLPHSLTHFPYFFPFHLHTAEFEASSSQTVMIRDANLVVARKVLSATGLNDTSSSDNSIIISGARGVGKSSALFYAALAAKQSAEESIILHVNASKIINDQPGLLTPSTRREGAFEQGMFAAKWMNDIVSKNADLLSRIPLKRAESVAFFHTKRKATQGYVAKAEVEEEVVDGAAILASGDVPSLSEFVTESLTQRKAPEAVWEHFFEELKQIDEAPIVLLIDDLNAFDHLTPFHDPAHHYKKLDANRLALVQDILELHQTNLKRGISIAATTSGWTQKNIAERARGKFFVEVKEFSLEEVQNALEHYSVSSLLYATPDNNTLAKFVAISGGRARAIREFAEIL